MWLTPSKIFIRLKIIFEPLLIYSYRFRLLIIVIVFLNLSNVTDCSEHHDERTFESAVSYLNVNPTPPTLPRPIYYQPQTTLPSQELYERENALRSSLIEDERSIVYHSDSIVDDNTKSSFEFNTDSHSDNTLSKTNKEYDIQHFLDDSSNKQSLSMQYTLKDYLFNFVTLIVNEIWSSSQLASEITNEGLRKFEGDAVQCGYSDLYDGLECVKQRLVQQIKFLTNHKILQLSASVQLVHDPDVKVSVTQRSIGSELWNTVVTFVRSRILKVTVPEFPWSILPTFVTTARFLQGGNNGGRFEIGLELPQGNGDTETEEGRGHKKKLKKFKKALLVALMTKAAVVAKAVLIGAVIIAKKALLVSVVSLVMSALVASKKKSSSKGDDHRRFGTVSYVDLIPFNEKSIGKLGEPLHETETWLPVNENYERYYSNWSDKYDDAHADNSNVNNEFEIPSNTNYKYQNEYNKYGNQSEWLGLTHPDNLQ